MTKHTNLRRTGAFEFVANEAVELLGAPLTHSRSRKAVFLGFFFKYLTVFEWAQGNPNSERNLCHVLYSP